MLTVGLTGSIGMGKSTTAQMFADAGIPVHDADAAVHELYAGKAAPLVEAAFPGTVADGVVDRTRLADHVVGKPDAMARLEAIVHPLVREHEQQFLAEARAGSHAFAILDIPLLFETGAQGRVDRVVVVTAPPDLQRERVLQRPGMTEDRFEKILSQQVPDAEKKVRADFVIDTSFGLDAARAKVRDIIGVLEADAGGRDPQLPLDEAARTL